jgi:hypothetical protein
MSVNLTKAGILPPTGCKGFAGESIKSRSSGSQGTFNSALKDIVIGHQDIQTCGTITIIKHTDPAGLSQDFSFSSTIPANSGTPPSPDCKPDTTAASFTLNDGASTTNTEDCPSLQAGTYTVTEGADPVGFAFVSVTCANENPGDPSTFSTSGKTATINLVAEDHVTCTYINKRLTGALKILKNSTKGGAVKKAGAVFSYNGSSVTDNGTGDEDPAVGSVCVSGLAPGTYTVNETSPPPGYGAATQTNQSVTVVSGTNCTNNLPGAGATATFTNPPLSDIQVRFRDGGSGETSATITCDNTTGTADDNNTTGWDKTHTVTGVKAPTTVHCTIVIDP